MSAPVRSIRLSEYHTATLDRNTYASGEIFYDVDEKTLRIMSGKTIGGVKIASENWANNKFSTKSAPTFSGTVSLGSIANVKTTGGTNGQVIQTDGAGNLTFASVLTLTQIEETLADYALLTDLDTALVPYALTTDVETALESYALSTDVATDISTAVGAIPQYTLPKATGSVLGGVKADGVTTQITDGVITAIAAVGAAAAGTLTGNTLAAGVVTSSLTTVGTLGSLTVTGATILRDDVTIQGSTTAATQYFKVTDGAVSPTTAFQVDSANGNTTIAGTASIGGVTTITGNTSITGTATISSSVQANSVTATNDVTVGGNAIISTAPTQKTHATNKQYVDVKAIAMSVALG